MCFWNSFAFGPCSGISVLPTGIGGFPRTTVGASSTRVHITRRTLEVGRDRGFRPPFKQRCNMLIPKQQIKGMLRKANGVQGSRSLKNNNNKRWGVYVLTQSRITSGSGEPLQSSVEHRVEGQRTARREPSVEPRNNKLTFREKNSSHHFLS